ncbi:MAG TPA: Trp biosynthesis-associated membrane protein [Jiangellaceae bacterium]|nr:Trp biosynthesis-associated membrane protein [Jiangellaceae bacterium]
MTGTRALRRGYPAALLCLAAGGALGLVAFTRTWGEAAVDDGLVTTTVQISGRDLVSLGPAVALLALAAVVAVPATRRTGRRLVGAVLATAGLVTAAWAAVVTIDLTARTAQWVGSRGGDVTGVQTAPGWAVLGAAASVLIAGTGLAVLVRGAGWPALGRRYERRAARSDPPAAGDPSDLRAGRETWDAMDRGEDPTS